MVTYDASASHLSAADFHRPRNHASRGSLMTSSSMAGSSPTASLKWVPIHSVSRARVMPEALALPVSYHAEGRASETCTWQRCSSSWWKSTTHFDSANPFGLVSSARTSGCGTCIPSACRAPAMVDVPLRPEPTTNTTRRFEAGTVSDTQGSLTAGSRVVSRRLLRNLLNHRWSRRALCARLETPG